MKKIAIGDVFEIDCSSLFAYAQYTHEDALMGELIQIPRHLYGTRQQQLPAIDGAGVYAVFIPLRRIFNGGAIVRLGNFPIPRELSNFPVFRVGISIPQSGIQQTPKLWDGVNSYFPESQNDISSFPLREAVSYPTLLDRIASFAVVN